MQKTRNLMFIDNRFYKYTKILLKIIKVVHTPLLELHVLCVCFYQVATNMHS